MGKTLNGVLVECTLKCLQQTNLQHGQDSTHLTVLTQGTGIQERNTELGRESLPVKLRQGGTEFSILFILPFWPLKTDKTVTRI